MNRIIFIFIFLSSWFALGFENLKNTDDVKQISAVNTYIKTLKKTADLNPSYPVSPNKTPRPQPKKKKIRGIEPNAIGCFRDEVIVFKPDFTEPDLCFSSQSIYFFHLFFGNEKRGPPVA